MAQTEVNLTSTTFAGTGSDEGLGMCVTSGDFDGGGKRWAAVSTCEHEDGTGRVFAYKYDSGWGSAIEIDPPTGSASGIFFGWAMTTGDIDGDGDDELVISAPGGTDAAADENGVVFVYNFNTSTQTFDLEHQFESNPDHGGQTGDNFGWSVALLDFNGDSHLDLAVGARYWSECEDAGNCPDGGNGVFLEDWTGSVYVYDDIDTQPSDPTWVEVTDADLVIRGEASWNPVDGGEQTRAYFGACVESVGDVNGDGYDDFLATAPRRTPPDFGCSTIQHFTYYTDSGQTSHTVDLHNDCRVGKAYLFAGAAVYPTSARDAEAFAKVVFDGEAEEDKFGSMAASGGDINGDGQTDLVISSFLHAGATRSNAGRVYVFLLPDYGTNGWPLPADKHWLASDANISIDGLDQANFGFGSSLACNGNTNKGSDSKSDLLVGTPYAPTDCGFTPLGANQNRGTVFLYRLDHSITVGPDGGHETWGALDSGKCIAYYHLYCDSDHRPKNPNLAQSIAFIGDANGDVDHNDDFVIGCPGWDEHDFWDTGIDDNIGAAFQVMN